MAGFEINAMGADKAEGRVKTEKFQDVWKEFQANVPDRTTTIEEKELAIRYIDRLLKCPDIPNEARNFWPQQKNVILGEIQRIKNMNLSVFNN